MSTQVEQPVTGEKKRKRGRETATDMVRSLGLVILVIVPVWYLAQAPDSDKAEIRPVDPRTAIEAFSADVPDAPVPGELPDQWRATSSVYDGGARTLRVGWVTPEEQYAEYAAGVGQREEFLDRTVGADVEQLEPVVVGGDTWEQYREADGSLSLVGSFGDATVVVGTLRATAGLPELQVLLRSLSR